MDTKTTFTDEAACKAAFKWIAPGLKPGINQEELVGAYKSWTQNSDYEKVFTQRALNVVTALHRRRCDVV